VVITTHKHDNAIHAGEVKIGTNAARSQPLDIREAHDLHESDMGGVLFSSLTAFATIFGQLAALSTNPEASPGDKGRRNVACRQLGMGEVVISTDSGEFSFRPVPIGRKYSVNGNFRGFLLHKRKLSSARS